ncbi:MAG: ShlB/FhaC/HecB family hemolysin secretion/activation protein [Mariniblastus sp.]
MVSPNWLLSTRFTGQAASERLLFSETLGLGGFNSIRGLDQRAYKADQGFIANVEFGPPPLCLLQPSAMGVCLLSVAGDWASGPRNKAFKFGRLPP